MRKGGRGFTLIELLVVIAIIGILSTIVLASLSTARLKSRDARRISDIKQLQLALAVFYDSNAGYPSALSCLAPTYISSVPTDPSTNVDYPYTPIGSGLCSCATVSNVTSYHLGAALEDPQNSALKNDTDNTALAAKCNGSPQGHVPFDGTSKSCDTAGGTEQCYDVTP
jgi:general secretion pathway protein G